MLHFWYETEQATPTITTIALKREVREHAVLNSMQVTLPQLGWNNGVWPDPFTVPKASFYSQSVVNCDPRTSSQSAFSGRVRVYV